MELQEVLSTVSAAEAPSLIAAFTAGILSFLSPCIFPLLPGYISFMSGESIENLRNGVSENSGISPRKKAFLGALFFGLGFTLVFVTLGATATSVGNFLASYKVILSQVIGVIVIIFGLHMMGVFRIKLLLKQAKVVNYKKHSFPYFIEAFILGVAFVLGWTPCLGPIIGGILGIAQAKETVYQGMMLLFVYSVGLWIPFLISALAINQVMSLIKKTGKYLIWIERIAGALLVIIGILLVTNQMSSLAGLFPQIIDENRL